MTGLKDFVVIDRLSVHNLVVKKRSARATYTLFLKDGNTASKDLIYSYDTEVFDPKDPIDLNLASLMVVQVACNYGLFCKEIDFEGLYDLHDKRFLADMMENTSREIYLNKLLSPNEFLLEPFNRLQEEKKEHYSASALKFTGAEFTKPGSSTPSREKFAILASGGKDSLLTYGIIKEIGDPHPVFVNESGRHWYTAYNAYHRCREIEPNTVKPWCNSDRMFNWFLRYLPFIRPDFQNVRADMYPIRLWTVAVFLFGVLPVVRKRNIGNILIGNEYDTTVRTQYKGIINYNSLYDQSKYFDNAFTRYYRKKGWNIHQFSMLRSLSELLILKILVKRYPELQKDQVSCHAAHKEGNVMKPCGNCEKCRRIVGMLKVLGEDPGRCGYTSSQVDRCLRALESKKVKQLGPDAGQLYHMLLTGGHISDNQHTRKLAKEHKEILTLRFDNERSMLRDLPEYVRNPILSIYAEYAEGISVYSERKWIAQLDWDRIGSVPYFINEKDERKK